MNKQTILIIALVLLGFPILSCGGCFMLALFVAATADPDAAMIESPREVDVLPEAETVPASLVTMRNFNRIRTGMTFNEVVNIVGQPTEQMSAVEIAGSRSSMFMWKADNFMGNMNITFQEGRVVSKAQFSLP